MRLIVDANIIFSAILNTNGKIADLILNSFELINFIAPSFLRKEIQKNYTKISKISGLDVDKIIEIEWTLYRNIEFIDEGLISNDIWKKSYLLVSDIDEKDTVYIAFAEFFDCKIWSGDKKLISGLKLKNYHNFVSTSEIIKYKEKF